MNWITNICGCLPFKDQIIGYLNSSQHTEQVVQQEKCTEETGPDNIYAQAKMKSFNFMQLEQHSDDEEEDGARYYKRQIEENQEDLIDTFWYPKMKGQKWDHYSTLCHTKCNILANILAESPSSSNYDKIYDSQDDLKLTIYCRLETLAQGKKINAYRFSFVINDTSIEEYSSWLQSAKENGNGIESLLLKSVELEKNPNQPTFVISQRLYKKLLVISPHQFIIGTKTQKIEDEDLGTFFITTGFSVKETDSPKAENYSRGNVHLCGLKVCKDGNGLNLEGYLNMQLQVSVSPSMLKQPLAKQIRVLVQKLVCAIRKTDQI